MNLMLALASLALAAKKAPPPPDLTDTAALLLGRALESTATWDDLTALCDGIGNRLSGSPALDRAVAWGAAALAAKGLATHTEPVMIPHWVRGTEKAVLLDPFPREMNITTLGRSVGTPAGGIDAEVVVVDSFDALHALPAGAVTGKMVLYDVPFTDYGETVAYRFRGASEAARLGGVAALVRSVSPESLSTPHTGVMGYQDDVPKVPTAAVTIEDAELIHRLSSKGPVHVHLELGAQMLPDAPSANVVAELKGRQHPEEIVVLGCHLDSWDVGEGAQDDGAGCAMIMEAGRLLATLPQAPRRTVRVVLYVNEENGGAGGKAYALAHASEHHVAALEADTGAGRPLGFRIEPGGAGEDAKADLGSLGVLAQLLAPIGANTLESGGAGADIAPLIEAGTPGFGLVNDMAPYWRIHHTPADTVDKIDPIALRTNAAAVAIAAWYLAESDPLPKIPVIADAG
jgi:Zn-dependent M28 family amino/carboxypeptidase